MLEWSTCRHGGVALIIELATRALINAHQRQRKSCHTATIYDHALAKIMVLHCVLQVAPATECYPRHVASRYSPSHAGGLPGPLQAGRRDQPGRRRMLEVYRAGRLFHIKPFAVFE